MRRGLLIGAILALSAAGWFAAYRTVRFTIAIASELDRATALASVRPRAQTTLVLDRQGQPAFAFAAEQRIDVPLDRVSRHAIDAVIAVEDRRFYSHYGLDPVRIVGAAGRNLRAWRIREGGSTITQQLARAAQLSRARTFERKIREAMIALRLEERYTKSRILEEYLNTVYFGEGFYGIEAASRGYFGKPAAELVPGEAALLAALVRSPSVDAPRTAPERARRRRDMVLRLMFAQSKLSAAQLDEGLRAPLPDPARATGLVSAASSRSAGGYFQEEVRRRLVSMFGSERVLRGGLRVYSTYEPALQAAAEQAVQTRIEEIVRSRRRVQDLQGSLVALDPATGDVLALVGGRSFRESSFNRATQARRQAGSAFKPIIFAAALELGYAPGSLLRGLDEPIAAYEGQWLPGGDHEQDEYTLRKALQVSSNRAAVRLLQDVGVGTAIHYAHRLGIDSHLPDVPSLALGTGEVTLMELTAAYGVFASEGVHHTPRLITRVDDADGTTIFSAPVEATRAIRSTTAFLMSSMLSDVVSSGTASGARGAGFTLPAAGKTGTTDDYADAWFVGYTPHLVTGVWFGLDTPAPIMSRGFAGVVAVPAWARFMKAATKGSKRDWYEPPADVERIAICRISGARAGEGCRHPGANTIYPHELLPVLPLNVPAEEPVYEDYFPLGSVPPELCPLHNDPIGTTGSTAAIVVERAYRSDGTIAITLRGGGN